MQAYQLIAPSIDSLSLTELPRPRPGPGEVLVRLRAASLNYLDLAVARGEFGNREAPYIPVADGAGDVAEVGSGVTRWQVGDRVVPGMMQAWHDGPIRAEYQNHLRGVTLPGSLAEFTVVSEASLVRIPEALSYREAASLPVAATTAWNAIVAANVRPGSTVVLLGTGGVSLFALQYAKAAGARVIVTSSSDAKLERARLLGADDIINYRTTPAWDDVVLDMTDGAGADLVLESVGAATFPRSLNAAALAGTVFVIGFVGGGQLDIPVAPIMLKTLSIVGNNTGSTADFERAVRAIAMNGLRPVIDEVFAFDDAAKAFRHLEKAGHVGKIVIDIA